MRVLVVPLFGDSPAIISEFMSKIEPDRIILCHTSSIRDAAHHNAEKVRFMLENKFSTLDEISVIALGCSEYPLSLGEAFSRMIMNDNKGLADDEKKSTVYHTLITQESPMGYFFGLTMLSILHPIRVYCHMSHTSLDISRTHPTDFSGDLERHHKIRRIPLFDQFDEAREWLGSRPACTRVFGWTVGWYDEDRTRYKERMWFGTSKLMDFASSVTGRVPKQSSVTTRINDIVKMPEGIRLIERNEENSIQYRITALGRSVGWIMDLTKEYPGFASIEE